MSRYHSIPAALFSVVVFVTPGFGQAAPPCDTREKATAILKDKYQEVPIGRGLAGNGTLLAELFVSKDGKTWTFVITNPEGLSCFLTAGNDWLVYELPLLEELVY